MEFIIPVTAIGCVTAVVLTIVDKVFSQRKEKDKIRLEAAKLELRLAEDRQRQQELRLAELRQQNEQLQKQLEWHGKLLETQDALLKRLGDGRVDGAGSPTSPASAR